MRKLKGFFLLIAGMSAIAVMFAGCTPPDYQLSTSSVPVAGGTISPSTGTFKGRSNVVLVASPAQYYKFVGWAGDASGTTNPLTVNMNSNKQLVAQFEKIKYNVQINSNPSDGGTVRPDSGQYEAGNMVNITATPANGYRFVQWRGDASVSTNPLSILVDKNIVITPNFIKQYTLAVSADPTSGTVSPNGGIYDAGTPVNLTATPAFPYAFKNWVGADDNNINPAKVTMNADRSVTAIFAPTVKGQLQTTNGNVAGGDLAVGPPHSPIASIPIQLNQYEWVQGEIIVGTNPPVSVYIQDPTGKVLKDFGTPGQANFTFIAQITGQYTITFKNTSMFWSVYNLSYTIYKVPQ